MHSYGGLREPKKSKLTGAKALFRARMTFSQSLLVTDGTFKLDYASVIFVDPAVQIDETQLSSLTTVAVCHMQTPDI